MEEEVLRRRWALPENFRLPSAKVGVALNGNCRLPIADCRLDSRLTQLHHVLVRGADAAGGAVSVMRRMTA